MTKIALIGPGLVGAEVLSQLQHHASTYLSVIGIINSKKMLLSPKINLATWKSDIQTSPETANLDKFIEFCATASPAKDVVIVDCTSSDSVAEKYPVWLGKGLHLVTPNKKGFSGSLELFRKLRELSSGPKRPLVYHESTVGAGLPIISTLNDLVRTGDEIIRIEGIFSGTLSYIFNNFSSASGASGSQKFSDIVTVAKNEGYTEPDPRDDLNGMDVARKVIILGRVAGLSLDTSTLQIENIVPLQLRSEPSSEKFMQQLPQFDSHFESLNASARANSKVLRYVGVVDIKEPENSCVKLLEYEESHPFASLKGSDNIISFVTKRFPNGVIVRGAGAGAAVTAFGIFSDILKTHDIVSYSV